MKKGFGKKKGFQRKEPKKIKVVEETPVKEPTKSGTKIVLRRIISGGQVGVDQAALYSAKEKGYRTGGTMPRSFETLNGRNPRLARMFNLQESNYSGYPARTKQNIQNSDGTLIVVTTNPESSGMKLTRKLCEEEGKPFFEVDISDEDLMTIANLTRGEDNFIQWLKANSIETLNIAGNSGKKDRLFQFQSYMKASLWIQCVLQTIKEESR